MESTVTAVDYFRGNNRIVGDGRDRGNGVVDGDGDGPVMGESSALGVRDFFFSRRVDAFSFEEEEDGSSWGKSSTTAKSSSSGGSVARRQGSRTTTMYTPNSGRRRETDGSTALLYKTEVGRVSGVLCYLSLLSFPPSPSSPPGSSDPPSSPSCPPPPPEHTGNSSITYWK